MRLPRKKSRQSNEQGTRVGHVFALSTRARFTFASASKRWDGVWASFVANVKCRGHAEVRCSSGRVKVQMGTLHGCVRLRFSGKIIVPHHRGLVRFHRGVGERTPGLAVVTGEEVRGDGRVAAVCACRRRVTRHMKQRVPVISGINPQERILTVMSDVCILRPRAPDLLCRHNGGPFLAFSMSDDSDIN